MNPKKYEIFLDAQSLGKQHYNQTGDAMGFNNRMITFVNNNWIPIKKYFKEESKVLDVGCGNCRHSVFFSNFVKRVDAIDKIKYPPEYSFYEKKENVFFQQTDIFDIKEKNYDVVFLNGVWYLYKKKDVLMQFLLEKTKDNGVIIINGEIKNVHLSDMTFNDEVKSVCDPKVIYTHVADRFRLCVIKKRPKI